MARQEGTIPWRMGIVPSQIAFADAQCAPLHFVLGKNYTIKNLQVYKNMDFADIHQGILILLERGEYRI